MAPFPPLGILTGVSLADHVVQLLVIRRREEAVAIQHRGEDTSDDRHLWRLVGVRKGAPPNR